MNAPSADDTDDDRDDDMTSQGYAQMPLAKKAMGGVCYIAEQFKEQNQAIERRQQQIARDRAKFDD